MVMVKPALAYGDLIRAVKRATRLPVAAYNVSGEYAMVNAAADAGLLDERAAVLEILTSLRRAGADMIITYHAMDTARWLLEKLSTERRWRTRDVHDVAARTARRFPWTTPTAGC